LVEQVVNFGSWQARSWLGLELEDALPRPTDAELASRFFLDDVATATSLRDAYGYR
jgi:hypothetical protein